MEVTLWVRVTEDGRIVYSGYKKELLDNFHCEGQENQTYYDVLLKGETNEKVPKINGR